MLKFFVRLQTLPAKDDGATAVEYALLVGLIAAVIIAAVTLLGSRISDLFTGVKDAIPTAP